MTFDVLIREALLDATRAVDRARPAGAAYDLRERRRAIGELAADLMLQRCPRLESRMTHEKLVEIAMAEAGD